MTHPTPAEVTAAERRPVHGGYPDATPSMRQRPIMLEIAKASDEHERRTTEWASFIATGACADLPDLIDYIAQMNGWPTLSRAARHRLAADRGGERERKAVALDAYDAGLLSDFGGGNVEWWQDYIRAELERAHDHYEAQFLTLASTPPADRGQGVPEGWRPEVRNFADLMEAQLRANDHKPGWKNDPAMDLIPRLREEAVELEEATNRHAKRIGWGDHWLGEDTSVRVGKEAADVANFAMMIADVCGALSLPAAPNGEA